jgi:hypothetical protein
MGALILLSVNIQIVLLRKFADLLLKNHGINNTNYGFGALATLQKLQQTLIDDCRLEKLSSEVLLLYNNHRKIYTVKVNKRKQTFEQSRQYEGDIAGVVELYVPPSSDWNGPSGRSHWGVFRFFLRCHDLRIRFVDAQRGIHGRAREIGKRWGISLHD